MKVSDCKIAGVKIVEPQVFGDSRGWFVEQYNAERYKAAGIDVDFVQDNESFSSKGVVRGLHWQAGEHAQAKLVRVIRGAVWDVAVDIRKGSPTFGKHVSVVLTGENKKQFFIPKGFAHGFVTLTDDVEIMYKCDAFYSPEHDGGIRFNDPDIGVEWGVENPILSEKDEKQPFLADIEASLDF